MSVENPEAAALLRKEGVVLIVLTATVYSAFLVREMGYADFFSIPHELIAASHIGLFSAAKALALGAVAYIGKVNLVWIFAPRGERFIVSVIRYAIGVALLLGFALYPYMAVDVSWWWLVGAISFLLFGWFGWPLITQRRVVGYENKVAEQVRLEASIDDIFASLFGRIDRATYITLGFVAAMMVFAYGDGRRSAIEQDEFNMVEGEANVALLRVYGEIAVLVAFDPKAKQLNGLVKVTKISDAKEIAIRKAFVGKLKRVELKK